MRRTVLLIGLVLLAGVAAGHVPRGGPSGGTVHVHDPAVSQVFYTELDGTGHTYTFDVAQGNRVVVEVVVPVRDRAPAATVRGAVNATLDAAPGPAVYEPFGPGVHRVAGSLDATAGTDGTVTVAVNGTGRYALVVGFEESFTPVEWAVTPLLVLGTYAWGGAPWWTMVLPLLVAVLGGAWLWHRRTPDPGVRGWLVRGGALLCFGSAAVVAVQMGWALSWTGWTGSALVTLGIVALQAGMGTAGVRLAGVDGREGRILLGLAAIGGVAVWAGYLAGPLLYLLAAALPADTGDTVGRWIGE